MNANLTPYGLDNTKLQPGTIELAPRADRILDLGGGLGGNGAMAKGLARACIACTANLSEEAIRQAVPGIDVAAVCDVASAGELEKLFSEHGPFELEHRAVNLTHSLLP